MSAKSKIEWTDSSWLKERLRYDPSTGDFTWLIARSDRVGKVAGKREHHGYVQIVIAGKAHMAHRLAWLYMTSEWPNGEIDHINLIKNDNRWSNLRLATRSANCANKRPQSNNTSGLKGVSRSGSKWRAQININGKRCYLGRFDTTEAAHDAYLRAAAQSFGTFARPA